MDRVTFIDVTHCHPCHNSDDIMYIIMWPSCLIACVLHANRRPQINCADKVASLITISHGFGAISLPPQAAQNYKAGDMSAFHETLTASPLAISWFEREPWIGCVKVPDPRSLEASEPLAPGTIHPTRPGAGLPPWVSFLDPADPSTSCLLT